MTLTKKVLAIFLGLVSILGLFFGLGAVSPSSGVEASSVRFAVISDYGEAKDAVGGTSLAADVSTISATLNGTLNSLGTAAAVSVSFEYGTTTAYGSTTPVQSLAQAGSFSATVSGLAPGTTYHYRAKAVGAGITYGNDVSFTTPPATTTVPPPSGSGGGGGGGGGTPPPAVISSVSIEGFSTSEDLEVDASGRVQATTQLTLTDGQATIDITKNTRLLDAEGGVLSTLSVTRLNSLPAPPPGQAAMVTAYELGPDGAQFNPPLTLTLKYDPQSLPANVNGNKVTLAFWDGLKWVSVSSRLDPAAKTVTAQIDHFSEYALLVELAPARFTLSELKISQDRASEDNPVTIQTVVTNSGGSPGKETLSLLLNNAEVNGQEISLEAGKSETVSFVLKNLLAGKYSVDINGQSSQFTKAEPAGIVSETSYTPNPQSVISETAEPVSSNSPESKATAPVLWVLLGVIVIAALILGVFLIRLKAKNLRR